MVVFAAVVVVVNSVNAVSAQNITCDLACQEAIINEADSDDIVDRMMKECGFIYQYWCSTQWLYILSLAIHYHFHGQDSGVCRLANGDEIRDIEITEAKYDFQ